MNITKIRLKIGTFNLSFVMYENVVKGLSWCNEEQETRMNGGWIVLSHAERMNVIPDSPIH
jgi:hypothetical protein